MINLKTIYFDCFAGISGDMFLGAMLNLGLDRDQFLKELGRIPLEGYEIDINKDERNSITGTKVTITTSEHHPHRHLSDICQIVDSSSLGSDLKEKIKKAFRILAEAEGKVHGCSPEEIHFHEIGAVDSIIDICGAFILAEMASADRFVFSPLNTGSGTVECAHGTMPVPAPATALLLKDIPVFAKGDPVERTTPTGALLARCLASSFSSMPEGIIKGTGTGIGTRKTDLPNILRVFSLETEKDRSFEGYQEEEAVVIETNIDDMNPQDYESVMELLFAGGAMDVWITPVTMKKGRPAVTLSCLCSKDKVYLLSDTVIRHTTTLGVRSYTVEKIMLEHVIRNRDTTFGKVRIKEGYLGEELVKRSLEYDDIKRISKERGIPQNSLREKIRSEISLDKISDRT
jgi:uncharacterized protein (TIGR00299 family) protein